MWPRLLLYAAEVALKLQISTTSTGSFFRGRFGEAESVPAGTWVEKGGFCTVVVAPTSCRCITCVLTTCWYGVSAKDLAWRYRVSAKDQMFDVWRFSVENHRDSQATVNKIRLQDPEECSQGFRRPARPTLKVRPTLGPLHDGDEVELFHEF